MTIEQRDKIYEEALARKDYNAATQAYIDFNLALEENTDVHPLRHRPKDPYKYCC